MKNRTPSGQFAKGASGNAGGRPKGLMTYARERTDDGRELIDFAYRLFKGELLDVLGAAISSRRPLMPDWQIALLAWEGLMLLLGLVPPQPIASAHRRTSLQDASASSTIENLT